MRKPVLIFLLLLSAGALRAAEARKPYTRNVAVVVYEGEELLDFAGPTEVFTDAAGYGNSNGQDAFHVYTVARTAAPLTVQGMLKLVPDYGIENAPQPDILILPGGNSGVLSNDPAFVEWTRTAATRSELTLTVCTGAFVLAKTGLLDGQEITTWYGAIANLRKQYPGLTVINGRRYIDGGHFVTTAGVSAGIDGSLHVVARLLGRRVADRVAEYMEYHWTPESYLSTAYSYWNPSTDDKGRVEQQIQMKVDEGQTPEAIAALRKIVADDSSDSDAWFTLGQLLRTVADLKGSAEAYSHVSSSSGRYAGALYNAACGYALTGEKTRAVEFLTKSMAAGTSRDRALKDPDLESIRGEVSQMKSR